MPAFPDVQDAFKLLHEAGVRVITLTNGRAEATKQLLRKANVGDLV